MREHKLYSAYVAHNHNRSISIAPMLRLSTANGQVVEPEVSILSGVGLWPVRASICRCSFLPYVELYENFRFTERLVFQRKTVQLS